MAISQLFGFLFSSREAFNSQCSSACENQRTKVPMWFLVNCLWFGTGSPCSWACGPWSPPWSGYLVLRPIPSSHFCQSHSRVWACMLDGTEAGRKVLWSSPIPSYLTKKRSRLYPGPRQSEFPIKGKLSLPFQFLRSIWKEKWMLLY